MACSALSAIEQEGVNRLFGEFVTRFPQVLHSFSADRILFAFDALQYTYLPAVFSAGHDGNIVNLRLVGMDDGCAVEYLRLDAGSIAELNRGAIDGIKDRLHKVEAIFYSIDGSAIQLRDTASIETQILDGTTVIHSDQAQIHYVTIMTGAEDRWKVRVLQSVEGE